VKELLISAKCDFMQTIDAPQQIRAELFLREHDSTVVAAFLTSVCGKQA
jgi:hypothetical protein